MDIKKRRTQPPRLLAPTKEGMWRDGYMAFLRVWVGARAGGGGLGVHNSGS